MKDSEKNNFGDDINEIGDQLRNVRITEKEYNFPVKNAGIVLNILCDNNAQDNKNYKIGSNINDDQEQPLSNEKKISKTDALKHEGVYRKAKSDSSSLVHNEVEKEGDESTEKKNYVSDDSKKADEKVEIVSRGPVSQKIYRQPYNPCSRGHHSGGRVRVTEHPSQPTMNGYQPWSYNSQFNILPYEQEQYPPSMETPFLPVAAAPTANINTISMHDIQGISVDDEMNLTVEKILQEHPYMVKLCDELRFDACKDNTGGMAGGNNQNAGNITVPVSPGDSGTFSVSSPESCYPPSVGSGIDSVLDTPSPRNDYSPEVSYDNLGTRVSDSPEGQVIDKWFEMLPTCNERPGPQVEQDMQKGSTMSSQVMQHGPLPHGPQQRPLPPAIIYDLENLKEIPDIQGQPTIPDQPIVCVRNIPGSGLGTSPNKTQGTRLRNILPKPDLSSAKARFQNILDKERRLLAWVKINEKVIADPKQLESQDAEGDTDLMILCCNKSESHLEMIYAVVETLRQKPNSLTIRNKQGHSALYLACEVLYDVPEVAAYIAEALIEQKVDVANMTYDGGFTLIEILEKKGDTHKKVLEGLLALKDSSGKNVFQRGGDVNANYFKDFKESILPL
ncbi:hypothetical protein R5R35_003324 [Gryllus longicercus]|uniref:Uncharacterized protein n=1 Tax=Gryllus longicercus TaxID=2509291 RepID=A0AAN9VL08_9ORTH